MRTSVFPTSGSESDDRAHRGHLVGPRLQLGRQSAEGRTRVRRRSTVLLKIEPNHVPLLDRRHRKVGRERLVRGGDSLGSLGFAEVDGAHAHGLANERGERQQQRLDELRLVVEVSIEVSLRRPRPLGDLVDRHILKPPIEEEIERGACERLRPAPPVGVALTAQLARTLFGDFV